MARRTKRSDARVTAAGEVVLAADDLVKEGTKDFSEWDLTVAAWKRDPNRFGCRGYEDKYPDHKRVMMEIMASKKDNPLRRGLLKRVRQNHYCLTDLGKAEADRLRGTGLAKASTVRSPGPVFDAVKPYVDHRSFRAWLRDRDEPRSWLGAAAFLGLGRNTPNELNDRIRWVETASKQALHWCDDLGKDVLTRGTHGGGSISRDELERLLQFLDVLQSRFEQQIDAIRRRPE